jgi:photosystem II stability/assembly factor-like uncharacterized protein
MITTTDGGAHWQQVSHEGFHQIRFFDDKRGCGTWVSTFKRTNDGGHTWKEVQVPHVRIIDRMFFLSPERGWLGGDDGKAAYVFRTSDGGLTWQESRIAVPEGLTGLEDLFFLDEDQGWFITWPVNDGSSHLFSTVDGGRSWQPQAGLSPQGGSKWPEIVRFLDRQHGFVFVAPEFSLMYTTDGGAHWRKHPLARYLGDCDVFEGDLLCAYGPGFGLMTLHPH